MNNNNNNNNSEFQVWFAGLTVSCGQPGFSVQDIQTDLLVVGQPICLSVNLSVYL